MRAPHWKARTMAMCWRPAKWHWPASRKHWPMILGCRPLIWAEVRIMNKPNSVPNPLAPHERTVPALLKRQAALFGAKTLLTIGDTTWRHDQAAAVAAGRAGALKAAGVEQGDRVAIMCSNRIEFLD